MDKEYLEYEPFLKAIANNTLRTRAELSLKYYIKMAVRYKWLWNILSLAGIVLPAAATFFASLDVTEYHTTIILITAGTTVCTGSLALFKCADKKTSYRKSAENLKSELCAYASHKGVYSDEAEDRDKLLFERMESIIKEGYEKIKALENNADTNKG